MTSVPRAVRKGARALLSDPRRFGRVLAKTLRRGLRLDYRFGAGGRADPPVHVSLKLTNRCNLKCRMCILYGSLGDGRAVEPRFAEPEAMSLDDWRAVVDSVRSAGPAIGITGGEPFLHRGCLDVVRHVKERGLYCGLTTNGTLLAKQAEEIVASGLDALFVSLDGPAEIHDDIRGVPGTFRRAVEGAMAVRDAKGKAGADRPRLGVNFTFVHDNHRGLEEVIAAAESIGAEDVHLTHLFFWTEEMAKAQDRLFGGEIPCDPAGTAGLAGLDPEAVHAAIRRVRRRGGPVRLLPDLTLEETIAFYTEPARLVKASRCYRPWRGVYVQPDGNVLPCLNYAAGNVRERPLPEIWNNDRFRRFRRLLRAHRAFPACARCCGLFDESL